MLTRSTPSRRQAPEEKSRAGLIGEEPGDNRLLVLQNTVDNPPPRTEGPDVGGASSRSRNGAPFPKACEVKGQMTTAGNK